MTKPLLIGLDQGSSSTKGILYDPKNKKILASERAGIKTRRRAEGNRQFVEHDPEDILHSVRRVLKRLAARAPARRRLSVGLACQRSSFLFVRAGTLEALTPVISWQDTRGLELLNALQDKAPLVYERTGLYLTPYYMLSKIIWLFEKYNFGEEARQGTIRLAPLSSYLAARLTKSDRLLVDPTHAQRTLLLNIDSGDWDLALCSAFGVPKPFLPELRETSDDYGTIDLPSRTARLSGMIGDQQGAYWALESCANDQPALINLGTGGFLLLPTGRKPARAKGLLSGILRKENGRILYCLEGTVTSIQGALLWLKNAGLLKDTDRFRPPKKGQWGLLPVVSGGFGGLSAPFWRGDVKVAVNGLHQGNTREDIVLAFLLGLTHLFWEILKPLAGTPFYPNKLTASGGLSKSSGLLNILAEYLDLPVRPAENPDLTALGACLAAWPQAKCSIRLGKPVVPAPSLREEAACYRARAEAALLALISDDKPG
ncbi:MAG: hypothetical protein HYT79_04780 [Elusimicrobia bacterium]|nr:hypothetical protein [Elusimicrobiota bacterium]